MSRYANTQQRNSADWTMTIMGIVNTRRNMQLSDELIKWTCYGTWNYIKTCKYLGKLRQIILKSERQADPAQGQHVYQITIERIS